MLFKVNVDIPEQRVKDLLCSAYEGGSNYWACISRYQMSEEAKERIAELKSKGDFYSFDKPFIVGVNVIFDVEGKEFLLNRERIIKGMEVMSDKYPHHFDNFMKENDDAETGDVFLQCCLFKEVIFG